MGLRASIEILKAAIKVYTKTCVEEEDLPSALWVLLAGLQIKLTRDRITGENRTNLYNMYTWETPRKLGNSTKWPSCQLKYHLQLKTKKSVGGTGLGFPRGGRQFTWKWKSKCSVDRTLIRMGLARTLPVYQYPELSMSVLGQAFYVEFF